MSTIDPRVRGAIDASITELVDDGKTFTAYDVTVKARTKTLYRFTHFSVRDHIHDRLADVIGYDRRQSATYPAFEYFPVSVVPGVAVLAFTQKPQVASTSTVTTNQSDYGVKPANSVQAGRKFWNNRGANGKFAPKSN